MATTYVQFTREEFESWLTSVGHKWRRKAGKAGIYEIPLSDTVAVEVSSSMTGRDNVVDYAGASMGAKLVSLVTGFTLNKVSQGQDHVKRTTNWRVNLGRVVENVVGAYRKSSAFYDSLAAIRDRDAYRRENLAKIERVPNWEQNDFLQSLHERLIGDGILTQKQLDKLDEVTSRPAPKVNVPGLMGEVRALYAVGKAHGDGSLMDFAKSMGELIKSGQSGTPAEKQKLNSLLDKHEHAIQAILRASPNLIRTSAERVALAYLSQV